MVRDIVLFTLLCSSIYAHDYHEVDDNILFKMSSTYIDFKNSVQKSEGKTLGVGLDIEKDAQQFQIWYTTNNTDTLQPPLPYDLSVDKIFFRYAYTLEAMHKFNLSTMYIKDNIAPTNQGEIYGLGYKYTGVKNIQLFANVYHSDYKKFNVNQVDMKLKYHYERDAFKFDFNILTKYMFLDNYSNTIFNPNSTRGAQKEYLTSAITTHVASRGYHAGLGIFMGKRLFAVMNDGFSVQHHAMEFDKTYFITVGKKFKDFNLMLKHTYQEAIELPQNNDNVIVNATSLIFHYQF